MKRDEAAFVEFASSARDRLRRTAYLACGDWDKAADHVQEGLVRVYVAWPRLQRNGQEYAYARKAVMSALLDHHRRRSSTERPVDHAASSAPHPATPDPVDAIAQRHELMAALAQLPPRQRACLVLRYFEDLSVVDTAGALGITPGTVKSQTSRALDTVRQVFAAFPTPTVTQGASR